MVMDRQETERRQLEEYFPDGPVETAAVVRLQIIDEPVERILVQYENGLGMILLRLFQSKDEFRDFADLVAQVARDAGCYFPVSSNHGELPDSE